MLIISGIITLEPSDHDAVVAAAGPLTEATLTEQGNITYGFWAHPTDRGVFRVYEEWQDQAAVDAHFATPHMAAFIGVMASLAITGTDVVAHEASNPNKIM